MADKQLWQVVPVANDVKNDDGVIIGGQTAGTRYAPLTLIANFVHNLWAAFINAITPFKTSFANGDKIPVVNGSMATAMEADTLLELTAQNALAGNVAPAFIPNSTTTVAGQAYVYGGSLYVARETYQGAWDASKFEQVNVSQVFAQRSVQESLEKTVSDISEKTNNIISVSVVQESSTHGLAYYVGEKNFVDISGTTDTATVDIDLALRDSKTLSAGDYCISLQGKFVSGGASVVAYLLDSSNNVICYGTFNSFGFARLTVASENTIYKVKLRFNGSGSAPDIEGNMQLEKGNAPTKFEGVLSAVDYKSRNDIEGVYDTFSDMTEKTNNIVSLNVVQQKSTHGLTYSVGEKNFVDISGTTDAAAVDIDLLLRDSKTLSAGDYCISLQGKFVRGGASLVAYLLDDSDNSICYGTFNADGYATLSVASESELRTIKLRFNGSGSTPDIECGLQLETGKYPTTFESILSAVDYKSRNDIDLLQRTVNNKVTPIFNSGSITSNGEPVYSNTDSSRQWIVTPKIYKVKKGSYIKYIGNKNIYLNVSKFSNGQFVSYSSTSGFNGKFIFNEDTEVRIAMRFVDYSAILPEDAASNLQFEFYSNDEQKTDLEMYFLGIGSGLGRNSGYAILAKLPNGKNLLVDSHLMSYAADLTVYLRNAGVRKIDYYVQTHYHEDHIGILNVLQNYPTRIDIKDSTAFLPPVVTLENLSQFGADAQTFVDRQDALEAYLATNDCTVIRPDSTTDYDLGGGVKLRFYNTDHSIYSDPNSGYYSTNYNDWSICPQLIFGMNVVNLSSDIGPTGERKVAGTLLKANILTAPHHGWDNGVNNLVPAFINNVSPDVVISVDGREHHPDNTDSGACVMKATSAMQSYCEANAVPNYLTCLNGQIKVIMNENTWKFDGTYSRYIRNGKNWSYTDNSEHVES